MRPSLDVHRIAERTWPIALSVAIACVTWSYAAATPTHSTTPLVAAATPLANEALDRANQLSDAFAQLAAQVTPSVVTIKIEAQHELPQPFKLQNPAPDATRTSMTAAGSGVVLRSDGHIVTTWHGLEHATRFEVRTRDGLSHAARLVGADPSLDLAVLKIDADGLPVGLFGDSSRVRVGEWVLALGAPFGLDHTLSAGVLSARGRGLGSHELDDYLQTDAVIHLGNAGGPLVDLRGQIIGINTLHAGGSRIGFAIPANLARAAAEQLIDKGKVSRPWLGLSFQELSADLAQGLGKTDTRGALVASVAALGPADRAGIRAGDVIEQVDGEPVVHCKDLMHAVLRRPIGSELALALRRNGKLESLKLSTAEKPLEAQSLAALSGKREAAPANELGLKLQALTPQIAAELDYDGSGRVAVVGVGPGSRAERGGIRRGDVIVEVERRAIQRPEEIAEEASDGKVMLRVDRKSGSFYTVLCTHD